MSPLRNYLLLLASHYLLLGVGCWYFTANSWTALTRILRTPTDGTPAKAPATLQAVARELLPLAGVTALWVFGAAALISYLIIYREQDRSRRAQTASANDSLRQTQQLLRNRDAMIFALAKLADSRDPETGDHLERISTYSRLLAGAARRDPRFAAQIDSAFARAIGLASALHDIGKVGVDDAVLRKPGPLTDAERNAMQTHAHIGSDCLQAVIRRIGNSPMLELAAQIARSHHERWDGSGYPDGLWGNRIPLAARIVALADVYDALASARVYKAALPHAECVAKIRAGAGTHFDPALVEVWLTVAHEFEAIADRYRAGAGAATSPWIATSTPPPPPVERAAPRSAGAAWRAPATTSAGAPHAEEHTP